METADNLTTKYKPVWVLLGWGFYTLLFLLFFKEIGPAAQVFAVLPSLAAGWFYGPAAGLVVGVVTLPFSGLLLSLTGFPGWPAALLLDAPGDWVIYIGNAVFGWFGGKYNQAVYSRQEILEELEARRKTRGALEESESRYRSLVEEAGDVVYLTDADGNFEYINPLGEKLTGYSLENLSQMNCLDLIAPEWRDKIQEYYLHQSRDQITETAMKFPLITRDGKERWIEQTLKLLLDDGEVTGFQGIMRDVTERHLAQVELSKAKDDALEANEAKNRLLATLTHDIRTPLSAILGYSDLISSGAFGPVTEEQEKTVKRIITSAQQVSNLITNMLHMTEIESGEVGLVNQRFNPHELIRVVQDLLVIFADDKNIPLTFTVDSNLPDVLMGDFQRVQQILINLVNNAIKFTSRGSVAVRLFRMNVTFWALEVKDTGPGIPDHAQEKIFQPFTKGKRLSSNKVQSTGLGLSIVKEFVDLMEGEITLTSQVGYGSTFTVMLPIFPNYEPEKAKNLGRRTSSI